MMHWSRVGERESTGENKAAPTAQRKPSSGTPPSSFSSDSLLAYTPSRACSRLKPARKKAKVETHLSSGSSLSACRVDWAL